MSFAQVHNATREWPLIVCAVDDGTCTDFIGILTFGGMADRDVSCTFHLFDTNEGEGDFSGGIIMKTF